MIDETFCRAILRHSLRKTVVDECLQKLTAKAERIEAPADRVDFAQAAVATATTRWALHRNRPVLPTLTRNHGDLTPEENALATAFGESVAQRPVLDAAYRLSCAYATLIPKRLRSQRGMYYTPPALVEHLLDMIEDAGGDWARARVLEPACGGGAFLAPVALRMARALGALEPAKAIAHISSNLQGIEIDAFSADLSQVFVEEVLIDGYRAATSQLGRIVQSADTLARDESADFDIIVGNPPYGRTKLDPEARRRFARCLYGHANIYAVFVDQALRLLRPGGIIGYVTPTSFLAGQYFKKLRALLGREAPPVCVGFVTDRSGVFADVLQETVLTTFLRQTTATATKIQQISTQSESACLVRDVGRFRLPAFPASPWVFPRGSGDAGIAKALAEMPLRLRDFGYKVSTGPLVWNRHKDQLKTEPAPKHLPLIWSESVTAEGTFSFRAEKKNHTPFFEIRHGDDWLIMRTGCLLVQRTTAKEQKRRLIAAELPTDFVQVHGGVVVENHLNMVYPINGRPTCPPRVLQVLFSSKTVDSAFRCMSGSVAVSAYELEALPLPAEADMRELSELVDSNAPGEVIERKIQSYYARHAGPSRTDAGDRYSETAETDLPGRYTQPYLLHA